MGFSQTISCINKDRVDLGLFVIRMVIGLFMAFLHGYGKLTGGPELWGQIGGSMSMLGITFAPVVWGFLAMSAEFFASLAIALGVFFRPAAAMLVFTMFIAAMHHLTLPADNPASGINGASHALELMAIFIGLFLTGPGRYRLALLWQRGPDSNSSKQ